MSSTVTVLKQAHVSPRPTVHSPPSVRSEGWDDVGRSTSTQQAGSTIDDALPQPGQRVFDVAPANILSKRRRFAVSVLIVLSNLIQVCCSPALHFLNLLQLGAD